jgi:hypothetical protein
MVQSKEERLAALKERLATLVSSVQLARVADTAKDLPIDDATE